MSEALKKIDKYRYDILRKLFSQCTEKQQKFFNRLYLYGIDHIPKEKLDWAMQQIQSTLNKKVNK